ncbi:MAG: hypothetical protein H6838_20240 [Planctomycetes bacterium]|nr:hypothetical protein [Planctomycetota bacterium]MCB9887826.1 hypothetical protein [Planctomycetota bacterium]
MHTTRFLLATATLAACVCAQSTLVTPVGYDVIEGNSNNAFPWNRGASSMHYQQIIDSTNFAGVTGPILIQGMRFRADATTASWAGGSWPNVQIDCATSTVDYLSRSLTFAANMAGDQTTVYAGAVTVQPGTGNGAGVPGPWHIQITFTTPFLYDPSSGNDFVFDVQLDGTGWSGTSVQADAQDTTSLCTRIWDPASSNGAVASGSSGDYGLVCEFTYVPAVGFAYSTTYGTGCYDSPRMVHEDFPVSSPAIDLANTSWNLIFVPGPTGGSYVITPGSTAFDPNGPLTGTNIVTGTYTSTASASWDDASLVYTLPTSSFPAGFDFPGGNCTEITINSNGKIFLGNTTDSSFITNGAVHGDPSGFRGLLPQLAPFLNDLDPTVGGGIYVEDPSPNGGVRVTWLGIPNWQQVGGPTAVLNDIQCEILPGGFVTWAYGANLGCSGSTTNDGIVGFSAGGGQATTAPVDWSTLSGYITGDGTTPLHLSASARPVIGTSPNMLIDNVPAGSPIAALVFGLTKFDPGIDLTSIGMPGCSQYSSTEATVLLIAPTPSTSRPFVIPNSPGLAGVMIKAQALSLSPSIPNALNANASNGLEMFIDIN